MPSCRFGTVVPRVLAQAVALRCLAVTYRVIQRHRQAIKPGRSDHVANSGLHPAHWFSFLSKLHGEVLPHSSGQCARDRHANVAGIEVVDIDVEGEGSFVSIVRPPLVQGRVEVRSEVTHRKHWIMILSDVLPRIKEQTVVMQHCIGTSDQFRVVAALPKRFLFQVMRQRAAIEQSPGTRGVCIP